MTNNFYPLEQNATLVKLQGLPSASGSYATAKPTAKAHAQEAQKGEAGSAVQPKPQVKNTPAKPCLPDLYLNEVKKTLHKRVKRQFRTYVEQNLRLFEVSPRDRHYQDIKKGLSETFALKFADDLEREKIAIVLNLNQHYRKFCGLGLKHGFKAQMLFIANAQTGLLPVLLRQHDFSKRTAVKERTFYIAKNFLGTWLVPSAYRFPCDNHIKKQKFLRQNAH